ncbi:MAG: SsrA-binding protein SmpB [Candidatus Omnitrophota bacterium]
MADSKKPVITNREASRDFHLEKTYEAGIQLRGDEVKSVRDGKANLKGSFARVEVSEIFVYGMHITPYKFARDEHDPIRTRKLLLNKFEIKHISDKLTREGYTLVPTKVYFRRGYAKIEIALAKGKKLHDKRAALKEKQANREMQKALREKNR